MSRAALAPFAVVVLLAIAAFGLASRDTAELSTAPLAFTGWQALPLVLAATGAWVLAATLVFARSSASGYRRAFRRALLINLVLVGLTAALIASTELFRSGGSQAAPFRLLDLEDTWTSDFDIPALRFVAWVLLALLLLGLASALVAVVSMLVWSLLPGELKLRLRVRAGRSGLGSGNRASGVPDALLATIAQARQALDGADEPRRAIIAAYAAMERAIVQHGLDRRAAQTPTEFLAAAIDNDLLRDQVAAERLRHLFELARFSHLPLPADAVETASQSLDLLHAELLVSR